MRLLQLLWLRLRLDRGANFNFFHGPALYGFLMDRLGNPPTFPEGCRFRAVETGRVRYSPAEHYHLGLALLPGARPDAATWCTALGRDPTSKFGQTPGAPFGFGTRLIEVRSGTTGEAVDAADPHTAWLSLLDLARASSSIVGAATATLRFDTPLQILRAPVARKDTVLDGSAFDPAVFLDRVLLAVREVLPSEELPSPAPKVRLLANRLVRGDSAYPNKMLPGAVGSVVLGFSEGIGEEWARALVLAGVLGVGKSTNMGQGRFTVESAPIAAAFPPPPGSSHAARAARDEHLEVASEQVRRGSALAGVDGLDRDAWLEGLPVRIGALRRRLADGAVDARPLRGVLLRKADGRIRGLAVPTVEERFLQRAVVDALSPAVDKLLDASSFAWRRGLSRHAAVDSVAMAKREGFEHVLRADLRSFFDSVDWGLLETRMEAFFGSDPVVRALSAWVRAPVAYAGHAIPRQRGIPQGAPISPLLANLYLDAFDEALSGRGLRLVRYGDDFVVLARTAADLERARAIVERELARLRLELAPEKTRSTSFDEGFRFLGFLLCQGVVLPSPGEKTKLEVIDEASWPELAASIELKDADASWVGDVVALLAGRGRAERLDVRWRAPFVLPARSRRPVYLVDPAVRVSATERSLRIWDSGALREEIAWERISEIVLIGGRYLHPAVLRRALTARVPVAFYTRAGRAEGLVLPDRVRSPGPLTRSQWAWADDPERTLPVARALVEAKIHNQRLVARHQPGDGTDLREHLGSLADSAMRARDLARLRGIEGQAAHAYFSVWPSWVAPLPFPSRSGRGASDPVNAVLNLLYTQLFRLCWLALASEGLDPYLGILHVPDGRYAALAADMQEPFRFLCERVVLDLVHRERLTAKDFLRNEKQVPPLRLSDAAFKRVLGEWERKLASPARHLEVVRDYRSHVFAQAGRLADMVRGEESELRPFRLKW